MECLFNRPWVWDLASELDGEGDGHPGGVELVSS